MTRIYVDWENQEIFSENNIIAEDLINTYDDAFKSFVDKWAEEQIKAGLDNFSLFDVLFDESEADEMREKLVDCFLEDLTDEGFLECHIV